MSHPSAAHPFVSVIVPAFGQDDALPACVHALLRQTYPRDRFEVLVVDNAPSPALSLAPDGFLTVRVLHEPQPGSYAARNAGIRVAKGEVLAFTDADCRPRPDWIERGVACLARQGHRGMVAGAIAVVTREPPNACERYTRRFHLQQEAYVRDCGFGATANVLAPRTTFAVVGLFNDAHFSGGDAEWGRAVHAAGLPQTYAPDAVVEHPARRTLRSMVRRIRRITGGRYGRRRTHASLPTFQSPFHRDQLRRLCIDGRCILCDSRNGARWERMTLLIFFLLERLTMMAEWLRLTMGGKPMR